jgi:hypothetical protein
MSPLFPELLAAHKLARKHDLQDALAACGLTQTGPMWGIAFVSVDPHHYTPSPGGKPAIIVPGFVEGELIDLVATGLETRAIRTRCGVAAVLGEEWLDHARETESAARLFPDPVEWIRNGRRGAVIIDWRVARFALADVPRLNCESDRLARQVDESLRLPVHIPQIFVRESRHHANQ